jgi:hypothetical protein
MDSGSRGRTRPLTLRPLPDNTQASSTFTSESGTAYHQAANERFLRSVPRLQCAILFRAASCCATDLASLALV